MASASPKSISLPILYHGVLVDLPGRKIRETIDSILNESYSQLLRCEDVMLFRPLAQSSFPVAPIDEEDAPRYEREAAAPLPYGKPVVALLDGLPLEHHELLEGRLIIDDENDYASRYQSRQQQHGTSMASLIAHGDLGGDGAADRDADLRPPDPRPVEDFDQNVDEKTPDDRLLIDVIHEAVRRIKGTVEGAGAAPA